MENYNPLSTAKLFETAEIAQQAILEFFDKINQKTQYHNIDIQFKLADTVANVKVPIIQDGQETMSFKNGIGEKLIDNSIKIIFKQIFPEYNWKDIQNALFILDIVIVKNPTNPYWQINYSSQVNFNMEETNENDIQTFVIHKNWFVTETEYASLM